MYVSFDSFIYLAIILCICYVPRTILDFEKIAVNLTAKFPDLIKLLFLRKSRKINIQIRKKIINNKIQVENSD